MFFEKEIPGEVSPDPLSLSSRTTFYLLPTPLIVNFSAKLQAQLAKSISVENTSDLFYESYHGPEVLNVLYNLKNHWIN